MEIAPARATAITVSETAMAPSLMVSAMEPAEPPAPVGAESGGDESDKKEYVDVERFTGPRDTSDAMSCRCMR
jgi:hypothetical protein